MRATSLALPHGNSTGRILEPVDDGDLTGFTPATLFGPLAEAGYLVLRGFDSDMASFTQLVKGVSTSTTLDPARAFYSEVAQKVDAGFDEVGLHTENGNSPFRAHVAWFFCEKAAASGSQTTVCDGYHVWDALSERAHRAFSAQDIVYSRYVAEPQWRAMAAHVLGNGTPGDEITLDEVMCLVEHLPGMAIIPQPNGGITYSYTTPAVGSTLFGKRPAFANSILGPSYNYEAPRITFADGTEIDEALLAEIRAVTEAITEEIGWRDGDIAVVDNTRTMHGRRAITDPDRTIYNAMSYVEVEAL